MLYVVDDFPHKILSMGEAFNQKEADFQDYLLREFLSEGALRYPVVQKQPDGTMETITIEKHGPVAFMVTTTRNKLHPENETRMLSIEVDDSAEQTRKVIEMVAEVEGLNRDVTPEALDPWHDFQRWLAAGECRVYVPFAPVLAQLVRQTKSVRLRRDFGQLLRGIKAHALLHRQHRRRTKQGSIIATIQQDYAPVRSLLAEVLATASEIRTRKAIKETVTAIAELQSADPRAHGLRERAGAAGVNVREIAEKLKLDKSSINRRLRAAEEAGLVLNLEDRRGRPGRYEITGDAEASSAMLPKVRELQRAWQGKTASSRPSRQKSVKSRTGMG